MPALSLSIALSRNPMTAPILSGQVSPEGVEWTPSGVHPSEMFWRQLKFGDFDISEMSLSSLTIASTRGTRDWVPIPVFTTRRFFHTGIVVREGAGIAEPADLAGKRIGVPEYQQTAAVWSRGALWHEFGVRPEQCRWFMERPPTKSHGGSTGFTPPDGVELSYIPTDTNIGALLSAGELDAALVYIADRNLVDRTRQQASAVSGVRTLFADPVAEGIRYHRASGILPVNHAVVLRASLVEKHPWLPLNVYGAFVEAKRVAEAAIQPVLEPWRQLGVLPVEMSQRMAGTDPLPYGLAGQEKVLDALGSYLHEQGLVAQPVAIGDLFAPSTLDL